MASLDTLPAPVLRVIVCCLKPDGPRAQSDSFRDFELHDRQALPLTDELVALASCNKALRHQLLPTLFRRIALGETAVTTSYAFKLEEAAQCSKKAFACVRVLAVEQLLPDGILQLVSCIRRMTSLECVQWHSKVPLAPILVDALRRMPRFHRLHFQSSGTESLPHVLPLADKVTHLKMEAERLGPYPGQSLTLAPVTVGVERRKNLPWNDTNVTTVKEQRTAFVKGLSAFLLEAKGHLRYLKIDARGLSVETVLPGARLIPAFVNKTPDPVTVEESGRWLERLFDAMGDSNGEYPLFPKLERLCILGGKMKCLALKHLLETTANQLTHLELLGRDRKELPAPPRPLTRLEYFYYLFDDNVSCRDFALGVTKHAPLQTLGLNGIRPRELTSVFGPQCACTTTLTRLYIIGYAGGLMTVPIIAALASRFVQLEELALQTVYAGEAVDFLNALKPLKKLRKLDFDHPWVTPRETPFHRPDGRTIRSVQARELSPSILADPALEGKVRDLVLADMRAVYPKYARRFCAFARAHPALDTLVWHCVRLTKWIWSFSRQEVPGEPGRSRVAFTEVAQVEWFKGE